MGGRTRTELAGRAPGRASSAAGPSPRFGGGPFPSQRRVEVAEYWKLAEVEDRIWYMRALHAHVRRGLAQAGLASGAGAHLLDAGCGTGGLILRLGRREPQWTWAGLDYSPLACELARRRCPAAEVHEGSVTALPFGDAVFDAVVSADVICQVPYPDEAARAVREFARVVRPGGPVVVNVPAYRWMWSYHDDTCQTRHRFLRRQLVALFEAAGLQPVMSTHWNCLPFPLLVLKRKVFRRAADTSDVRAFPAPVERLFDGVMAVERAMLRLTRRLPWGSSVLVVGRKRG